MTAHQDQKSARFSSRRRLLRLGAYVPPAVLGAMVVAQGDAWASGDKNSNSGGGNPSCAPCYCAPCGRDGEKNRKKCKEKRRSCNSSGEGNSSSNHS